jgi:hypothetical protein
MMKNLALIALGAVAFAEVPHVPVEVKARLLGVEKTAILAANGAQSALAEYYKAQVALQRAQQQAKEAREFLNAAVAKEEKELGCNLDENYDCEVQK